MLKKKEKNIPTPVVTESSTEEERALAADYKRQRFTALIMKSVILGLILLATLFSLFIPSMKRELEEEYGTDYSITLSVADELFGSLSMNSALEADLDSFILNGGRELINTDNDREKNKSASDAQILADVAYKRTLSFSKMKAQFDVEAFINAVSYRISLYAKELEKLYPQDKAKELINKYYEETKSAVGAVFDLFSYEIERNNYAGLGKFLNTISNDLSETTFSKESEKFLLGKYKWNEAFQTKLKIAVDAAPVIPELQDEFKYLNGKLIRNTNANSGNSYVFQLIFSMFIGGLDALLLIYVILGGIALYRHFHKQNSNLRGSWNMPVLFICALIHLVMFLITKEADFMGVFSAGAVVIALFFIFAVIAQIVYNKHLTKMRIKFSV